jgi:hypothetical protein
VDERTHLVVLETGLPREPKTPLQLLAPARETVEQLDGAHVVERPYAEFRRADLIGKTDGSLRPGEGVGAILGVLEEEGASGVGLGQLTPRRQLRQHVHRGRGGLHGVAVMSRAPVQSCERAESQSLAAAVSSRAMKCERPLQGTDCEVVAVEEEAFVRVQLQQVGERLRIEPRPRT